MRNDWFMTWFWPRSVMRIARRQLAEAVDLLLDVGGDAPRSRPSTLAPTSITRWTV